jgi:hypothetical protein
MINYKWLVPALHCAVEKEGLNNVVEAIHWRYRGTDENNNTEEVFGIQVIGEPNPHSFTEYSGLTIEVVSGWLESLIDVEALKVEVEGRFASRVQPIKVILPLPTNLVS